MRIYRVLNIKDLRALSLSTLIGEPAEERPARDREGSIGAVEERCLLLVFFCSWARSTIFRVYTAGSSLAMPSSDVNLDAAKTALKQAI